MATICETILKEATSPKIRQARKKKKEGGEQTLILQKRGKRNPSYRGENRRAHISGNGTVGAERREGGNLLTACCIEEDRLGYRGSSGLKTFIRRPAR